MTDDWERKYKAALMERIPALQQLKIGEAYKAVMLRMNETEVLDKERRRLENAINILNLLRDRI
jgi:hypothetical protein